MSKACSTALAQSEYSFSFPSLPGTQKSQMREHCILNSSAYLPIAAVATQLYSIISSTKEDRKLLVVMTMESRCRTCPVIRKILQSWHSLRTERERESRADDGGETLQSGMCPKLPTTKVLTCSQAAVSLRCGPQPLLLSASCLRST